MYLIRHDASGNIYTRSYTYSEDAYEACVDRVMSSCEQHSVLWTSGAEFDILDENERPTGERAVQCERMITMSGGDSEPCDITAAQYEATREYNPEYN